MKLFILQLLTAVTATGFITLTVTHMHYDPFHFELLLWLQHWITAIPIALITVRYIAPWYKKVFKL